MASSHSCSQRATWILTLLAVVATTPALATTDQERWAAHQELTQAQDLKKKGDLDGALAHYRESARLDAKLATLTELAELEEQLGKLEDARTHWTLARDKAAQSGAPNAKQRAEERLVALEKRFAHLTLSPAPDLPSAAQVYRDEVLVEHDALAAPAALTPGNHVIVVKAPEHQDAKYEVKLGDGESETLSIAAGASTAPPPPPPPPPVAPPKPMVREAELSTDSGSSRRTLGLVAGAAGIVAIGVGIPLWYVGYRDGNSLGQTANQRLLAGQIAVIGGGVLLGAGIVLLATAPKSSQAGGVRVAPSLALGPGSTLVGATGQF
jgi:hypothetical protein